MIKSWKEVFGEKYKKLEIGFNFLKNVKGVDFESGDARPPLQRQIEEKNRLKIENIWKKRVERVKKEMNAEGIGSARSETKECLTQLDACLMLLLPPSPDEFDAFEPEGQEEFNGSCDTKSDISNELSDLKENESDMALEKIVIDNEEVGENNQGKLMSENKREEDCEEKENSISEEDEEKKSHYDEKREQQRIHGFVNPSSAIISVNLAPKKLCLSETEDNASIVQNLRDQYRLLTRRLIPMAKKWAMILGRAGSDTEALR